MGTEAGWFSQIKERESQHCVASSIISRIRRLHGDGPFLFCPNRIACAGEGAHCMQPSCYAPWTYDTSCTMANCVRIFRLPGFESLGPADFGMTCSPSPRESIDFGPVLRAVLLERCMFLAAPRHHPACGHALERFDVGERTYATAVRALGGDDANSGRGTTIGSFRCSGNLRTQ